MKAELIKRVQQANKEYQTTPNEETFEQLLKLLTALVKHEKEKPPK